MYFGFDDTDVLGVVAPEVEDDFVAVTPCRVMQLRNAAKAVELAPDFPASPPPPKEPAGRRLAHALNAALALGFEARPPEGGVPPPPVGRVPVGALTPCDFRQLMNAELDADVDVLEDEEAVVVDVDVVGADDDDDALPHAASSTPATAMVTTAIEMLRNFGGMELESLAFPMGTSMESNSGCLLMVS